MESHATEILYFWETIRYREDWTNPIRYNVNDKMGWVLITINEVESYRQNIRNGHRKWPKYINGTYPFNQIV